MMNKCILCGLDLDKHSRADTKYHDYCRRLKYEISKGRNIPKRVKKALRSVVSGVEDII